MPYTCRQFKLLFESRFLLERNPLIGCTFAGMYSTTRYNIQMHYEGVLQVGIDSSIIWWQPHWHAAVDADEIILPWLMVDRWLIRYNYVLFLRRPSKIVYRQAEGGNNA